MHGRLQGHRLFLEIFEYFSLVNLEMSFISDANRVVALFSNLLYCSLVTIWDVMERQCCTKD